MNVLLLGATGYIGSVVAEHLTIAGIGSEHRTRNRVEFERRHAEEHPGKGRRLSVQDAEHISEREQRLGQHELADVDEAVQDLGRW